MVIAQDNFTRPNQAHWGTASDGQVWQGDAATGAAFTITNNTGTIARGSASYSAVLGPATADSSVLFTGTMSSFSNTNFGALLRYQDANDWYKAYINGGQLVVQKRVAGAYTTLGSAPFAASANIAYSLRFMAIGSTLYARVWPAATAEPTTWMVTVTDTALASGFSGLRMLDQNGAVIAYSSFVAVSNPTLTGAVLAPQTGDVAGLLIVAATVLLAPRIARRIRRRVAIRKV